MKHKIRIFNSSFTILFLLVIMTGCGADNKIYIEQTKEISSEKMLDIVGDVGETLEAGVTDLQSESFSAETEYKADSKRNTQSDVENDVCYVYVCGAVQESGVYVLKSGERIYEAIAQAGGLTEDAAAAVVNQAEVVSDGQMIYVPTKEEADAGIFPEAEATAESVSDQESASDDRVNLNTASESELMMLPGIGESKAQAIISYRTQHGAFLAVEDIMNVDGIKEGMFNRIKDSIKVK